MCACVPMWVAVAVAAAVRGCSRVFAGVGVWVCLRRTTGVGVGVDVGAGRVLMSNLGLFSLWSNNKR